MKKTMKIDHQNGSHGFTLVELMIVISMITILAAVSIPAYQQSILHAKEATLRQDLWALRNAIDQYSLDKAKAPQALEDLVTAGYLRALPKDPFTNSDSTWQTVNEDVTLSIDQQEPGISDVHSGAPQTASDGTAYSSW